MEISDLRPDEARIILRKMSATDAFRLFNSSMKTRSYFLRHNLLEEFVGDFEMLAGTPLALVAQHLAPFEVILFCAQSGFFKNLCNRRSFWKDILQLHHGINASSEEARQLYFDRTNIAYVIPISIYQGIDIVDTLGVRRTYLDKITSNKAYITIPEEPNKNNKILLRSNDINEEYLAMDIKYSQVASNSKPWLHVKTGGVGGDYEFSIHNSKEEAVMDYITNSLNTTSIVEALEIDNDYEDFFDRINEPRLRVQSNLNKVKKSMSFYAYDENEGNLIMMNSKGREQLKKLGYVPFEASTTVEEYKKLVFDYIMANNFYIIDPVLAFTEPSPSVRIFQVELVNQNSPYYDLIEE